MNVAKISLRMRLKLALGTPRRLVWNLFRPGYVRANLAQRMGECRRCGVCCRLVWRCLFFHHNDGLPACKVYSLCHPPNCSNFPIDRHDLADRDLIAPDKPCGFWWQE